MRSETPMTICMSCSTSSTVMPPVRIGLDELRMKLPVSDGFMPDTGSSSSSSDGWRRAPPRLRAGAARRREGRRPARWRAAPSPTKCQDLPRLVAQLAAPRAHSRQAEQRIPEGRAPAEVQADQDVLEHAVGGRRSCFWNVRTSPSVGDLVRLQAVRLRRDSARSPRVGRRKPVMTLNAVVLPAPFGPIRPTTSPSRDREAHVRDGDEPAEMHRDVLDRETEGRRAPHRHGRRRPAPAIRRRRAMRVARPRPSARPPGRCRAAGRTRPGSSARRR